MLRAIVLSLSLMVGLGVVLPFVSDYAEAGAHRDKHKKKHRKYKKYSKNWWRLYHLRQRRIKSAAQRRAVRLRQIRLANALNAPGGADGNKTAALKNRRTNEDNMPAMLPSGDEAPKGWKRGAASTGELQFRVDDENGSNIGSASIAVVGPSLGAPDGDNSSSSSSSSSSSRGAKTVGGVQTSSLRRTVIDRMIREEGWVVNDYQKEVDGKKVFVVVAQSPGAGGKVQSRLFYFTESGGQIYSVATNAASGDNSKRIEAESERVITSLQRKSSPAQQAQLK